MRFTGLVPMLHTEDVSGTAAWYAEVLGFEKSGQDGERWCALSRDGVTIMFMRNDHLGTPGATATQYVYVDDVMALWAAIEGRVAAEWGPERMPYGMLEFAIRDPNGYLLSFGQRVT
jgi:uncharacterized glyoxalase superfamily protein PhnB